MSLILSDTVSFNAAFALSIWARIKALGHVDYYPLLSIISVSTPILIALMFSFNQYSYKRNLFDADEFIAIFKSFALTAAIIIFLMYIFKISAEYSRFIILISFIMGFLLVSMSRYTSREFIGILRSKGYNIKNVCIISNSKTKKTIKDKIKKGPYLGYKITGSIKNCDIAFVSSRNYDKILDLISSYPNVEFKIIPDAIQTIIEPAKFDEFADVPLINVKKGSSRNGYLAIKMPLDIVFSLLFLIITLPLFILISILNFFNYGEIFFVQKRIGKELKQFKMYKFQTMKQGKKPINEVNYLFKAKKDPRVTKFGKVLRRSGLDELPQLINILFGEMSFVGPRPCLKEELHLFRGWKRKRFSIKPGITGLWQVSGRHDLNLDKAALLDIYYASHMSLALDLKIILKTIPAIVFSRGRW